MKHIPVLLFFFSSLFMKKLIRSPETGALSVYYTWFVLSLGFSRAKSDTSCPLRLLQTTEELVIAEFCKAQHCAPRM